MVAATSSRSARHRVCVALSLTRLVVGDGSLGHERLQVSVIGVPGEVRELFVDDPKLLAKLLQAAAELGEAALDQRARHAVECTAHR